MATNDEIEKGKACAVLSYLFVGIIWYFADENMKKNSFAKFHTKQSIILLITCIAVGIANSFLMMIPVLGWLAMLALNAGIFILWILGLIASINGQEKELPVIGQFSSKLTF